MTLYSFIQKNICKKYRGTKNNFKIYKKFKEQIKLSPLRTNYH